MKVSGIIMKELGEYLGNLGIHSYTEKGSH
jgi:hypothetical protein